MKTDRSKFKATNPLILYSDHISMEFAGIKEYIDETQDLINSKRIQLEAYFDEIDEDDDSEYNQSIVGSLIDEISKYGFNYTELLMQSAFVSSYSLFENFFSRLCVFVHKRNSKGKAPDLRYIDRCKEYLENVIKIDFSDLHDDWNQLQSYRKLRNSIVHNSGSFWKLKNKPLEEQELYEFITSNKSLKVEDSGYFHIKDSKFIKHFCVLAESYLLAVISKLNSIKST